MSGNLFIIFAKYLLTATQPADVVMIFKPIRCFSVRSLKYLKYLFTCIKNLDNTEFIDVKHMQNGLRSGGCSKEKIE